MLQISLCCVNTKIFLRYKKENKNFALAIQGEKLLSLNFFLKDFSFLLFSFPSLLKKMENLNLLGNLFTCNCRYTTYPLILH